MILAQRTLIQTEQKILLRAKAHNLRDHMTYSLGLGIGLRLAEIVSLGVGDV